MTDHANDTAGMTLAHRDADHPQPSESSVSSFPRQQPVNDPMTDIAPSSFATTLKLRVAEARVEDIGRAVARIAPTDLKRMGARPGDVVKITGSADSGWQGRDL